MASSLFRSSLNNSMAQGNITPESIPMNDQIIAMWKQVRQSANPQQLLESMMRSNPQVQQTVQALNSMNDPKEFFYQQARAKGMSDEQIEEFLNRLRNTN